jgi:hypothetical protein
MKETLVLKQSILECGGSGILHKFMFRSIGKKKGAKRFLDLSLCLCFGKLHDVLHIISLRWRLGPSSCSRTASISRYEVLLRKTDLVSRKECLKPPKYFNPSAHSNYSCLSCSNKIKTFKALLRINGYLEFVYRPVFQKAENTFWKNGSWNWIRIFREPMPPRGEVAGSRKKSVSVNSWRKKRINHITSRGRIHGLNLS